MAVSELAEALARWASREQINLTEPAAVGLTSSRPFSLKRLHVVAISPEKLWL
jgi:hypothetical protein